MGRKGKGNGAAWRNFRKPKGHKKQDRPRKDYGTELQRVELSLDFVKCGRLLSKRAKLVYADIISYNPSHPSLKQICIDTGYAREAVCNALEELEIKNMLRRFSGKDARENNLYVTLPKDEWNLLANAPRPKDKIKKRREERGKQKSFEDLGWFEIRTKDGSKFERGSGSKFEQESDQFQSDQSINKVDASRQSGVALKGEDMRKPGAAELRARWEKEDRERASKKARSGFPERT